VTELRENSFVAILSDKTNPTNPDEQGEFEFDNTEISPEDRRLLSRGSSFYWIIGSEHTAGGQIKTISMMQLRRIPTWTARKPARVTERAERAKELFRAEE
jgi:hypothetical protein